MDPWWQEFFDAEYLAMWSGVHPPATNDAEAEVLWALLDLSTDDTVLDAPCGYGRVSEPLAERGVNVIGVDASVPLIEEARRRCERHGERARFAVADLRQPLPADLGATGCDAAINLFSSIGYGTEDDDRAIFASVADALRDSGRLFVDTMHRDVVVARRARGAQPGIRLPDGTEIIEEQDFDPITGRAVTTWRYDGPKGRGEKTADLRLYTSTELVALISDCGFELLATHAGVSHAPFDPAAGDGGGRLGLLFEKK